MPSSRAAIIKKIDGAALGAEFFRDHFRAERPLNVVFDCSNGPTGCLLKRALKNHPAIGYVILNSKPDGDFPAHGPDSTKSGALTELASEVRDNAADLGVAFDADGDRAVFVGDDGEEIGANAISRLLLESLAPKKALIDLRVGWLVKDAVRDGLIRTDVRESRVGHYFIKKAMRRGGIEFASELSGHYYFRDFFYADSGLMAAAKVIEAASRMPESLSAWKNSLPRYHRLPETNFEVENKTEALRRIEKRFRREARVLSRLDGLSLEFDEWWLNLRPSNTENLLRLNLEARTKRAFDSAVMEVMEELKAKS